MKKGVLIVLFLLMLLTGTFTQDNSFVSNYTIGETKISVIEQCCYPCHRGVLFINLHDNENASVKAAEQYLNEIGGRLINIENNGERLINFRHRGEHLNIQWSSCLC